MKPRKLASAAAAIGVTLFGALAYAGDFLPKRPPEPVGVILSHRTGLQRLWDAAESPVADSAAVIPHFEVQNQDVPSAVAQLSNQFHVVCGIAVAPWPRPPAPQQSVSCPFKSVSASFTNATVAQVLDGLTRLDPTFEWREDRGIVDLALRGILENPAHPLNRVIPRWTADGVPYYIALYGWPTWSGTPLFLEDGLGVDLPMTIGGSGLAAPDEFPLVTIDATNETPLQILNDVARELRLSWWMFDERLVGDDWMTCVVWPDVPGTPSPCPCASAAGSAAAPVTAAPGPTLPASTQTGANGAEPQTASTLVPLRDTLERAGFALAWDSSGRRASASNGTTRVAVRANDSAAVVNGVSVPLPAPTVIRAGRLLVPRALLFRIASGVLMTTASAAVR